MLAGIGKHKPGRLVAFHPHRGARFLGSFITEPAAMTISALLLARQFYELSPSLSFRYGTLGLLFVNVSVGGRSPISRRHRCSWSRASGIGTCTFMFTHLGWKAARGRSSGECALLPLFPARIQPAPPRTARADGSCRWAGATGPMASRSGSPRGTSPPRLDGLYCALSGALHRRLSLLPRLHSATSHHQNPDQPETGHARRLFPGVDW